MIFSMFIITKLPYIINFVIMSSFFICHDLNKEDYFLLFLLIFKNRFILPILKVQNLKDIISLLVLQLF